MSEERYTVFRDDRPVTEEERRFMRAQHVALALDPVETVLACGIQPFAFPYPWWMGKRLADLGAADRAEYEAFMEKWDCPPHERVTSSRYDCVWIDEGGS